MATNGTDVVLLADVSGVDTVVGSQRGVTFDGGNDTIDVSSKESRAMKVLAGRLTYTVSLEHLFVPSDAAFGALEAARDNGTLITIQRQESGTPVKEASAIVTSLSEDFPDQAEATVSIELAIDGEWTDLP